MHHRCQSSGVHGPGLFVALAFVASSVAVGCSTQDTDPVGPPGNGGSITSGGSTAAATGGSLTTGGGTNGSTTGGSGASTTGGAATTGGSISTGGTTTNGGGGGTTMTGGGTTATGSAGGVTSTGGATSSGGAGGKVSAGGSIASGGAGGATGGTAGKTSTGGSMTTTGGTTGSGGGSSTGGGGKACHSTSDWTASAGDLWISPTGNDANTGTEASPKKTLTAAVSAWSAGKTIWVSPGTYSFNAPIALATSGTASAMLRISGLTGGAKPVFDFSGEARATSAGNDGQRGLQLSASYVHLRYLEIKNAADNCVYVTGSNNIVEWLSIHNCQDTGLQMSSGPANNKILNVDSYLNQDPTGENADGFAPKLSIGQNNYFCGTRSYQNSDDGYDCWAAGDTSPVTFEYCWAFGQPGPTATANSDGNGFKLGSPASRAAGGNAPHKLINCFAFNNRGDGFTANGNNSGQITCTNCGVWGNGQPFSAGTGGVTPKHTGDITNLSVTVEKAMNAPRDANGDLPDITKL